MYWLSRPATITCIRTNGLISLVFKDQVLEAVLTARDIPLERLSPQVLILIGRHARDVLGRFAGQCQTHEIAIRLAIPEWRRAIDPWIPIDPKLEERELAGTEPEEAPALVDLRPVLDAALGGALVAIAKELGDAQPERLEKAKPEAVFEIAQRGAAAAIEKAGEALQRSLREAQGLSFKSTQTRR
jgi:hypothetical protein